jgi:hypothetical protein
MNSINKQLELSFNPEQEEIKRLALERSQKNLRSVLVFNQMSDHLGRINAEKTFHRPTIYTLIYILEGLRLNDMKILDLKPAKGLDIYSDWLEYRDRGYMSPTYMELIKYIGGYNAFMQHGLDKKFDTYFDR